MDTAQEAQRDASWISPAIAGEMAKVRAEAAVPSTTAAAASLDEVSDLAAAGEPAADEMATEAPGKAAAEHATVAEPSRTSRFPPLAAAIALAAALGSIVGSLSASGLAHVWPAAATPRSAAAEASATQAMKAELAELAALKASLDGAARGANSQFAKISDRLDRLEHAQNDPSAKIAHMAEAVDRLEKKSMAATARAAAPETTGAIGSNQPAAPGAAKLPDKVLPDWVVQDVRRGHALVEHRDGALFTVSAGSVLPGLGLVESVKRQDGQWVVVTARGLITEH